MFGSTYEKTKRRRTRDHPDFLTLAQHFFEDSSSTLITNKQLSAYPKVSDLDLFWLNVDINALFNAESLNQLVSKAAREGYE